MDIAREIQNHNRGREAERLQLKYRNMRADPFAFLRGTCHLFYRRLPRSGVFGAAPLAWVCGDFHFENVGSYKGDNRLVYFDINDFDEAALAPASWDLVRMLVSVRVGADSLGVNSDEAQRLCVAFLDAYAAALHEGKASWLERETTQGLVRELLDRVRERRREAFIKDRTERADASDARSAGKKGGTAKAAKAGDHGAASSRVLRIDGQRTLAADEAQRAAVTSALAAFATRQPDPPFYRVLDVARRIAGSGSLGLDRYTVLVQGRASDSNDLGGLHLLDVKQSLSSSLTERLKVAQPVWKTPAHRTVELQRRLQAVSMARLHPIMVAKRPCVLRELQPSEDRVRLGGADRSASALEGMMTVLGRLLAWAQLRSAGRDGSAVADEFIEFGQRRKWRLALLDTSRELAQQVVRDAGEFNRAYDDGVFRL